MIGDVSRQFFSLGSVSNCLECANAKTSTWRKTVFTLKGSFAVTHSIVPWPEFSKAHPSVRERLVL